MTYVPPSGIPAAVVGLQEVAWPIDVVFMAIVNTDPATLLGIGTWVSLGTDTLAGTTVYVWKRTA